ncbi:MAG TPA: hypothetical protein PLS49_07045 [Candidatus Woesebacteria bacterium]|nr:hypothetical protein [Candidatus Woesebacteria bacterium]
MIETLNGKEYLSMNGQSAEITVDQPTRSIGSGSLDLAPMEFSLNGEDRLKGSITTQYMDTLVIPAWESVLKTHTFGTPEADAAFEAELEERKKDRWKKLTGVDAQDSKLSVMIPAFKVGNVLPQVLTSYDYVSYPAEVEANTIIISNGVEEQDANVNPSVMEYLSKKGKVLEVDIEQLGITNDEGDVKSIAHMVQPEGTNHRYIHISVKSPNKGNSLNVGNQVALNYGHECALGLDSNKFPEPNAIPHMYKAMHRHIREEQSAYVLTGNEHFYISDVGVMERTAGMTPQEFLDLYMLWGRDETIGDNPTPLGFIHAWDTQFVHDIGGYPKTWVEDDTLGLISEHFGKPVVYVEQARVYRPERNTMAGRVEELKRRIVGALQIKSMDNQFPGIGDAIDNVYLFLHEDIRNEKLAEWAENDPTRQELLPLIHGIWEYIVREGENMHKSTPLGATWKPDEVRDNSVKYAHHTNGFNSSK